MSQEAERDEVVLLLHRESVSQLRSHGSEDGSYVGGTAFGAGGTALQRAWGENVPERVCLGLSLPALLGGAGRQVVMRGSLVPMRTWAFILGGR